MDNLHVKIQHFIANLESFFSSIWSYVLMLLISIFTNDTSVLFSLLMSLLLLDYITGIIASWIESNGIYKVYFIETKRLRESGVKVIGYLVLIICSWFVANVIYTEDIRLFGVIKGFNILELTLIMCAGIEMFSNLENLKRSGFDVFGKIKDGSKKVWDTIKSIKGQS